MTGRRLLLLLQWVSSHRQSERPQVSRPLVRWWSAGRRWRSTTRALLTAHNESAILFRIWRFFLTLSQRWIFRYGCVGCVRKKRIHYWAKIVVFWLSSDPQHKSFLLTLIQGSVVFDGSSRRTKTEQNHTQSQQERHEEARQLLPFLISPYAVCQTSFRTRLSAPVQVRSDHGAQVKGHQTKGALKFL